MGMGTLQKFLQGVISQNCEKNTVKAFTVKAMFVFVGCLLAVACVSIFSFITVPECVINSHQRVLNEGFEM